MAEDGELREGEGSIHTATIPAASSSTETGNDSHPVDKSSFTHTPFYCEENVYLLCKKLSFLGVADRKGFDLFVIFISNEKKQVPLWCQKASKRTDGLVLWDYHVICIQSKRNGEGDGSHLVWDLDSSLPFPFSLDQYMTEAIRPSLPFYPGYSRLFRVIHAPVFLRCFASDRRHMKDHLGNWISPPPTYEPFVAEDGTVNNLDEYIRMSAADVMSNTEENLVRGVFSSTLGVVVGETQLEELFSQMCKS